MATRKTTKKSAPKKETAKKEAPVKVAKIEAGPVKGDSTGALAPTLKGQVAKVGGPKHCICGCGAPARGHFRQGHDQKLRGALRDQATTKEGRAIAQALAGELGWTDRIKWPKLATPATK